jgi:hypothetical protein
MAASEVILPSISHGLRALLEKVIARERLKFTLDRGRFHRAQISLMNKRCYTPLPPSAIR